MRIVPAFIINLKKRTDRKAHILNEFYKKDEFKLEVVTAIENEKGAIGLWMTIKHILENLVPGDARYILICEDDHQFTGDYNKDRLISCINEGENIGADIISGGPSWFDTALPFSQNLFWADNFTGLQFTIIFKKFFEQIINARFESYDKADHKICSLTCNAYFIYPFLSTQKEFGYSDATPKNNIEQRVEHLYEISSEKAALTKRILSYYHESQTLLNKKQLVDSYENLTIPTYIINLDERKDRKAHISQQFCGRNEFDVIFVNAVKDTVGALGLWKSIRKIIQMAIDNEDDVIIIAEDDHEFTSDYSKERLLKNIIEAHEQGADYLSGGTSKFDLAIPITSDRYWVNHCLATQFIILFRKFFDAILAEPYTETVAADMLLSEMSSNKMVLYPFISFQRNFGYSDITTVHNNSPDFVQMMFNKSDQRLKKIQNTANQICGT